MAGVRHERLASACGERLRHKVETLRVNMAEHLMDRCQVLGIRMLTRPPAQAERFAGGANSPEARSAEAACAAEIRGGRGSERAWVASQYGISLCGTWRGFGHDSFGY